MDEKREGVAIKPPGPKDEMLSGIARLNVLGQAPSPEALRLIPEAKARKYNAIPLSLQDDVLRVAVAEPENILVIEALAAITKKRIETVTATPEEIHEAIDFNYRAFGEIAKHFGTADIAPEILLGETAAEVADNSPVAQALNLMIEEAVKSWASDIHIEPALDRLRVRYRIDGILHEVASLPLSAHGTLISRIKILATMNIADHLRPQDGQISASVKGKNIDIRVATINTVHGEMAVLRILDQSLAVRSLPQLGLLAESMERFQKVLMVPYGMVLSSGPTGAGKTTTLYASLNSLDRLGRNIITLEDPVEYRFDSVNQIQVNVRAGLTFATGLRSILRLDPDVILVGEIRDAETAEVAIQSALTGHLVLSSVHANDTAGVLFRLIDLGIERFLICSSVVCVLAQRMVRCVCTHCARKITAPVVEQIAYREVMGEECTEFLYGAGCRACTYTGYRGRTGIFEIMVLSEEIKRLLLSGASATEIKATAIKEGMSTVVVDGMRKARAGMTTPYEVLRNAYTM